MKTILESEKRKRIRKQGKVCIELLKYIDTFKYIFFKMEYTVLFIQTIHQLTLKGLLEREKKRKIERAREREGKRVNVHNFKYKYSGIIRRKFRNCKHCIIILYHLPTTTIFSTYSFLFPLPLKFILFL